MTLELTPEELNQVIESLHYHYECADNEEFHKENCRIIAKIEEQVKPSCVGCGWENIPASCYPCHKCEDLSMYEEKLA